MLFRSQRTSTIMDAMFRKSLADLVRGIRSHKKDENEYINKCLQEIKEELRLVNKKAKMVAVQKLTYLHMLGYDVTWAAFNIIEVMSQPLFTSKRVGYLAASQTFTSQTDVLMLATNLFKKDIGSSNPYESGVAINGLSNVCSPDLARDLAPDLVALLSSSRPYVRKKAVLVLYKVFLQFPQALRPAFPRLKEKLEDADMGVVSSAVNVICELARKNPKNYLTLAPILFKILTVSTNNWMLIKIIKLFGSLTPLEKRLGKKLIEPITNIMNSTTAMSLLYECIQTCTIGLSEHASIIRLCITKLRVFIEDPDQNLKYLGLLALARLMKIAPKAVQEHKDTVLACLDDEDITIRQRALDLTVGMVNKRNISDIVKKLMEKLNEADGIYRDDLIDKIITICSQDNYIYLTDFEWYISVLVELTRVHGTKHGKRISDQLMDVCIRVKIIREYGVLSMVNLLNDPRLTDENPVEGGICEVIYAAAWIVGEFAEQAKTHSLVIESLLQPRVAVLPGHIQAVNIQNSIKVLSFIVNHSQNPDEYKNALDIMKSRLPIFTKSGDLETQERACFALELVNLLDKLGGQTLGREIAELFAEPLNPVAEKAQRKVPLPPGLDLDQQINTPPPSDSESEDEFATSAPTDWNISTLEPKTNPQQVEDERKRVEARKRNDPFYLGSSTKALDDEDYPTVEVLTGDMINLGQGASSLVSPVAKPKIKRKHIKVMTTEEMPEGADDKSSDGEADKNPDDLFSNVDLETSLRPGEELTVAAYPTPTVGYGSQPAYEQSEKKKRRKHRGERGEKGDKKERRRRKEKGESKEAGGTGDLLGLGEGSAPAPASPPQQSAPAPAAAAVPAAITLAGENGDVKLAFELGINPNQPDKIMALFHIRAVSNTLGNLEFSVPDTPTTRLIQPSELRPNFTIQPQTHNSHRLIFQFKSFINPQKLKGSLSYQAGSANGKLDFEFIFPCATFVQPASISLEEFNKVSANLPESASKVRYSDARAGLALISSTLHVTDVAITDRALLYGKSTLNHHVCVFVERRSGGFGITIKCSDETFGANLLHEVKAALRK